MDGIVERGISIGLGLLRGMSVRQIVPFAVSSVTRICSGHIIYRVVSNQRET